MWKKTKAIRMIADDEKIERPRQLYALATRSSDFLAFGEAVGILRREPTAECPRVHRERRMQVRIAKERTRGKVAVPAYGEYGGLDGKASLADVSSSVPTSVMGCSAANAGRAKPAIHDMKIIRNVCFISLFSFRPRLMSLSMSMSRLRP